MKRKIYMLLVISFIALLLMVNAGCKKEAKEPEVKEQAKVEESIAAKPLPDSAYRADISISPIPKTLKAGSQITVQAKVKNISDTVWPTGGISDLYVVKFGYHWLDEDGKPIRDGGRVSLPKDLAPGEEISLMANVKALSTPGKYKLVFDMVHEKVKWFAGKESKSVIVDIKIQ